jgi:hypothetical protein
MSGILRFNKWLRAIQFHEPIRGRNAMAAVKSGQRQLSIGNSTAAAAKISSLHGRHAPSFTKA